MKELTLARRLDIFEQLATRIIEDERFKTELYREPKTALSRAFDLTIPDEIDIHIVEDTREVKHLLLPFETGSPEEEPHATPELPDEQTWYVDILKRAEHDDVFRHRLINNPRAVLCNILHIDLPESYEVRVIEETADQRYLLLPYIENHYDLELNDENLELVVGGKSSSSDVPCGEDATIIRSKSIRTNYPRKGGRRRVCL